MKKWTLLPFKEKAELIKVGVRNGLTSMTDIQDAYNSYALGGNMYDGISSRSNQMVTWKGLEDVKKILNTTPKNTPYIPQIVARGKEQAYLEDKGASDRQKASYGKDIMETINKSVNFFLDHGWTKEAAVGMVSNLFAESRLNPAAFNGEGGGQGAYGIAQWRGPRLKKLRETYGKYPTLENQLEFVLTELGTTHKKGAQYIQSAKTAEDAARQAMGWYEFSVGPEAALVHMKSVGQDGTKGLARRNQLIKDWADNLNYASPYIKEMPKQEPELPILEFKQEYKFPERVSTQQIKPTELQPLKEQSEIFNPVGLYQAFTAPVNPKPANVPQIILPDFESLNAISRAYNN